MSAEQNMAIARDLQEGVWNRRDMSVVDQLVATNHVNNGPFADQMPPGKEGFRVFASTFISAFPDVHGTIENQEADGDLVKTWVTFRGTQTGQLMDIPPTGREATVPVLVTDRISGGKIVETWSEWDPQDMMRQLGVA